MNRAMRMITFLSLLLVFTGCSAQPQLIEDIQFIQAMGYDLIDGETQATGVTTIYMPAEDASPENATLNVPRDDLEDLYSKFQAKSSRYMDTSRSRVHLFHEELAAEEGVFPIFDTIQRNPMIEQDMKVAVTKGTTKEILEGDYPLASTVYRYLLDLIELNKDEQIPQANFHDFLYLYYAEGADPHLPLLKKQGDHVVIIGTALFKGDKYIEEMDLEQAHIFRMLIEDTEEGTVNIDLNEDKSVGFHHLSTYPDWTIKQENDGIHVQVDVEIEGVLRETQNIDVSQTENIQQLETIAAQQLQTELEEIIHFLQENEIDTIGIGERVGQNVRGLDIQQWEEEEYTDLDVEVNVDFTIENTGAVE
ncbi:spore germination protein [Geomicrobium halophilum]|uniref:Spore germination protein n=1 Tax=Geomicrobium halophilum TaxID=549000 RepID=A0A841PQ45_9BACL|nr:Ger(x)C family spore germination protein [Geomicrobium halophilum]MBB6450957.1 spore germination protein [Geomicrobium halophilum]